ncbi:ParA family protein [Lactiplantibacillus plantarum]|uniref:ParA family protein n=1 Tax=Lactiplantibacillus plantarum TaxID=1590 RepID=UPI00326400AF
MIIDTPPTVSVYTDSALMASDSVIIVLQTQERSYVVLRPLYLTCKSLSLIMTQISTLQEYYRFC